MMTRRQIVLVAAAAALLTPLGLTAQVKIDSETFGGLEARAIGPAAMSGRITAIDAVQGERLTIWVGAAAGGVWKSMDGGLVFKPVFDKHNQSIGAIAVDPSDPKKVWVGTGESCTRNSVSVGDGIYRTTDGGDTWQNLGLTDSERISKVVVNPKDGNNAFVCATGHLFNPNPERGVYRTEDGGKTWKQVKFVNADTGCADVVMDPADPRTVIASMWDFRRWPWFFRSGGPGSGLYKSTDGGDTWRSIRTGLPTGDLGRIALAVSPANPRIVYANVESKQTALYRSTDGGEAWTEMGSPVNVTSRPFYFSHLSADPKNPDRIYKPGTTTSVSEDGGKTWGGLGGGGFMGGGVHADHHAFWINPKNPEQLILGTDGGVYVSEDRGSHWRFVAQLPLSQFYHVTYDMDQPYNVYGGLQDNSTWMGPSRAPGGIANRHWKSLGYGDGFWTVVDAKDTDVVYLEYQGGNLMKQRKSTGEIKEIKPYAKEREDKYRFNWNTPIHQSPSRPGTIYYGAQYLLRSSDQGESWTTISPDLTTNDKQKQKQENSGGLTPDNSTAENHCTIYTIAESPKNPDLIWVGTDDGNLQLTRDGGKTWTNLTANLPGMLKNTWVSHVEAARFDEGWAFATFDGHMTGDMKPHVYRTTDYGKTWNSLGTGDLKGFAHVIRQDLVRPELLFLGTELGLFVSLDGGTNWAQFSAGLPSVPVRDVVVHPRDGDLIIATHGRGVYIVDDLKPLRDLTPQTLDAEVALLGSRPVVLDIPAFDFRSDGDTEFSGTSPSDMAYIAYYLKKRHVFGDLKLEVYDQEGKLISTINGGKRRGINRTAWPMRMNAPKVPPAVSLIGHPGAFSGPRALPGIYTVKLIKGKDVFTSKVEAIPDPRAKYTMDDRVVQHRTVLKLYDMLERLTSVVASLTDVRDQARARAEKLPKDALRKRVEALADSLENQRKDMVSSKQMEGITGEEKLREELGGLYGAVNFHDGRPTDSQLKEMGLLEKRLDAAAAKVKATIDKEAPALSTELQKRKLDPIVPLTEEAWKKPR